MKIDFEFETQFGVFRDAIHLPDDHGMSDDEINQMKQQRLDNWLAIVNAPPVEEVEAPTQQIPQTVDIAGETYQLLEGTPPSGAKLLEINGNWYYKV